MTALVWDDPDILWDDPTVMWDGDLDGELPDEPPVVVVPTEVLMHTAIYEPVVMHTAVYAPTLWLGGGP